MKKIILAVVLFSIALSGCGTIKNEPVDNTVSVTEPQVSVEVADDEFPNYEFEIPFEKEKIIQNIEIKPFNTLDGNVVVFLKNGNDFVIPDLELQILYYKDGNVIEAEEDGHDALVPENTVVSTLETPSEYDSYDIVIDVDWNYGVDYRNWIYNLKIDSNIGEQSVIVNFENLGDINIEELEYAVVFYKGDDIAFSYESDIRDFEANSKKTEEVITIGKEFDGYKIYVNQAHTFWGEIGDIVERNLPENIDKLIQK